MTTEIVHSTIEAWAESYQGEPFHAMLCDPPYELGFMGKTWDRTGVAFNPKTWAALGNHLLPGAFGMAFASSRGWHRMAVAIEDAGFRIHPTVFMMGWTFGSGFPKASRVKGHPDFEGHRYGGQALKPMLEPIIVFQKPYEDKPIDSIVATGAGALNVDGSRIKTDEKISLHGRGEESSKGNGVYNAMPTQEFGQTEGQKLGRWPPNFVGVHLDTCRKVGTKKVKGTLIETPCEAPEIRGHKWGTIQGNRGTRGHGDTDGTETVDAWECADGCPVAALDAQAGTLSSGVMKAGQERVATKGGGGYNGDFPDVYTLTDKDGDTGNCSRFFHNSGWEAEVYERLEAANPVFYTAKASRSERDAGLTAGADQERRLQSSAGLKCKKCKKWKASGSPCVCPEPDFEKTSFESPENFNTHPTVKPLALAKYLATLLLPPAKYGPRRLLVPFAGTGSECIGAEMAGWEEIVGVERGEEYVDIARQRVAFWVSTIQLKLF